MAVRTHVTASEIGEGAFAVQIAMGAHTMIGDEPVEAGGSGIGPSPFQLMCASLAECTAMTVRWFARQHDWPLEHVKVTVDHVRKSMAGAQARDVFEKTVSVRGDLLTVDQRLRLIEVAGRCPVQRVLEGGSLITTVADTTTARVGP